MSLFDQSQSERMKTGAPSVTPCSINTEKVAPLRVAFVISCKSFYDKLKLN